MGPWTVDFFAIANIVALCFWYEPKKILLRQDRVRNHLISCLEAGQFSMFPFDVNTRPKTNKTQKIRVYFTCRRPHDGTKMKKKCVNCSEWFHPNCLCVVSGHIPPEFFCEFCMTEFDDDGRDQ